MDNTTKPAPVVGMAVTWIDPSDDENNAHFIETSLHQGYGCEGLRVHEIRDNGRIVTLERNGQPLMNRLNPEWKTETPREIREVVAAFGWGYLKPI